jgi:hypothetical protein
MDLRYLGGWALLSYAALSLLPVAWVKLIGGSFDAAPIRAIALVAGLLFVVGLPAIWALEPQIGGVGLAGLVLMEVGAVVAVAINVYFFSGGTGVGEAVPFVGALVSLVGALMVGWRTVRARVVGSWIGWLLILGGVLYFAGGLIDAGSVASTVGFLGGASIALAMGAFGRNAVVVRRRAAM